MPETLFAAVHVATEWTLTAQRRHADPWHEVTVDAALIAPDGTTRTVPAFWDGGDEWRLRICADAPGTWRLRSSCSDAGDSGLHGREAVMEVRPLGSESNPLRRHGPVRVAGGGFVHADGTPFFWLGDTWWMLMSDRVRFPDGLGALIADRAARGFTVAQVVVGYAPDLATDHPAAANEGGLPWQDGRINPRYFAACDARLAAMIRGGIVPCIVGSWGYHLLTLGEERMASHWRYLVARYAAWPVIWCLAGEGAMAWYLTTSREDDVKRQKAAWSRIANAVRVLDPWRRPLTMHPRVASWEDLDDCSALDFHMLQPGHMSHSIPNADRDIAIGRQRFPGMPVVNGEPPYEQHMGAHGPDVQRHAFWATMLAGAGGFTYGAAGIFQANDRDRPSPRRPEGGIYDAATWDEALSFPGAQQVALGKALLMELPWTELAPHPEWIDCKLRWGAETYHPPFQALAAGVPRRCRVHYVPRRYWHWEGPTLKQLEPGVRYRATYFDPARGTRHDAGVAVGDAGGSWQAPVTPYLMDWVLVLVAER